MKHGVTIWLHRTFFITKYYRITPFYANFEVNNPERLPDPMCFLSGIPVIIMKINKVFSVVLYIFVACLLYGCSGKPSARLRIGVSQCSSDDWRSKMNSEIEREIMFHPEAEVEIRSADDDNGRQIEDIRYFADNGFDIIIAAPNQADALTPVISEVYAKGIPVILFDRNINGDTYTSSMYVDNKAIGGAAARYARHLIPSGDINVLEIEGLPGSTPADDRHTGFAEGIALLPSARVLASVHGNWNQEDATAAADSLLKLYPQTNLIYAHNDRMAIGASEVARRLGRRDIKIIGIDAAPEIGIKAVAEGVIDATFLYPTEGHRLVRLALAILSGGKFDKDNMLPMASAVDSTNADILLLQNESIKEETAKMTRLKSEVDEYWERHSAQTTLFYATIVIILLLLGVLFLVLRTFWQHKRYQNELLLKNSQLADERDKQEQLNRQLSEATNSKLVFFTNVSHDLRTPLTLIAEPVEQLARATNLTAPQRVMAEVADRNVRILKRLINEILDFRKFENGKLNLHLSEVSFSELLDDWFGAFMPLARKRNIRLVLDKEENRECLLAVDVEKMERVVFNLLSNALKFTPPNGTVTLRCRCDGERMRLSVSDTGIGIAASEVKHVFDRFYQVDSVDPKGSGIGLWLVKSFVELHGGTVEVESDLDKGACFTVDLPVRHVETFASSAGASGASLDSDDIIKELDRSEDEGVVIEDTLPVMLVIDDNADIRTLVKQTLVCEYNVIQAADGKEGLRMAAKYVPDIVLCDVMMPVMDGMECCRRIKEEVSTSHIPVLMLTACSLDEQRMQGYRSGADAYLTKPFDAEMLRSRCANLLANRRRITELYKSETGAPVVTAPSAPSSEPEAPKKVVSDIDSEFYARFLAIAEKEISKPEVGVDEIAAMMGLGRSQFYRKIKALTNFSPVELLRQMRLKHARTLLTTTEKNISEIAYETGFSTPAYFTKCFRDVYGKTPTELREELGMKK